MPDDLKNAVDAPRSMTLADGREYTFSPIGMGVLFGEFRQWVMDERRRKLKEIDAPDAVQVELFSRYLDGLGIEELMQQALTVEGAEWLLWRALHENHPDVERSGILALFENLGDMMAFAEEVVNLPDEADSPDPRKGQEVPAGSTL